jgi:hypothetical protein
MDRLAKEEEKQRAKEEMQRAKEEKQRAKEEKRRAKAEKERAKAEKRKAIDEDTVQDEAKLDQPGDATRLTQSRSKRSKRKSGF